MRKFLPVCLVLAACSSTLAVIPSRPVPVPKIDPIPEPPPEPEPMSEEERQLELAAYEQLLKELLDLEREINRKLASVEDKTSGMLSFVIPGAVKKRINISVRAGHILLDYVGDIKSDLQSKIEALR